VSRLLFCRESPLKRWIPAPGEDTTRSNQSKDAVADYVADVKICAVAPGLLASVPPSARSPRCARRFMHGLSADSVGAVYSRALCCSQLELPGRLRTCFLAGAG